MKRNPGVLPLVGLFVVAVAPLFAQSADPPVAAFGVDTVAIHTVSVWDAQGSESLTEWVSIPTIGHRYQINNGFFIASVHLPEGARIESFELEACDTSPQGSASAVLLSVASGTQVLASALSGDAPGCGRFAAAPFAPHTVSNTDNQYLVVFANETYEGDTSIGSARVGYRLQVSPAPAVPTFNDVPLTDPAFRYIEALVSSGITAGCGSGNYCPDNTLTRRQMAVFLAKALGLQWP